MELRQSFGAVKSRLTALNMHDAVMRLTEGGCDLLIAYHHPSQPLPLPASRYEMLQLSSETLAPYAKAGLDGQALFKLPGQDSDRVPFLGYASGAYMALLVEQILKQAGQPLFLDPIYETDMAEGLKAMALEGHGLAFLPHSSVRHELGSRRLVSADSSARLCLTMEVRIYRQRPELARHPEPAVQALWDYLGARSAAALPATPPGGASAGGRMKR